MYCVNSSLFIPVLERAYSQYCPCENSQFRIECKIHVYQLPSPSPSCPLWFRLTRFPKWGRQGTVWYHIKIYLCLRCLLMKCNFSIFRNISRQGRQWCAVIFLPIFDFPQHTGFITGNYIYFSLDFYFVRKKQCRSYSGKLHFL